MNKTSRRWRWASLLAGRIAGSKASRALIPWFIRHYGVDVSDAERPPGEYHSLQEFFGRALRPGARPINTSAAAIVSPVDGIVGASGTIEQGQLVQAKGRSYTVAELIADPAMAATIEGGVYSTLYLAPANYHRVHAPLAGRVEREQYVPGAFWPVNQRAVERVPRLFAINERRVVYIGDVVVVLVGACLVGSIRMNQAPPYAVERGQELGRFAFGSTVIVLVPRALGLRLAVAEGDLVRVGCLLAQPR
jgi:phosphatidylserine decarboxylase